MMQGGRTQAEPDSVPELKGWSGESGKKMAPGVQMQNIGDKKDIQIMNSRDLQRVRLKYSAEY